MTISSNISSFNGKSIENFDPETGIERLDVAYKFGLEWGEDEAQEAIIENLKKFASDPKGGDVTELVMGAWDLESGDNATLVATMIELAPMLANLEHIFWGDINYEESEMSWIENTELGEFINAYPNLKSITVRGGNSLGFKGLQHTNLEKIVVQTGGMGLNVLQDLIAADLPNIEHLELWLGVEDYGRSIEVTDLATILEGSAFPNLKYLGLCNTELANDIAVALKDAAILDTH